MIVLLGVHALGVLFRVPFFSPTHLPLATEASILLHFFPCAEIISACAIEVQQGNENFSTIKWWLETRVSVLPLIK